MRTYPSLKFKKNAVKGFTLIEVLVALFILSTGILGAVAMQASAKKGSFDAMQRSTASALAQDIIERMRGNNTNSTSGILDGYNGTDYGQGELGVAPTTRCNLPNAICTPAQLRANDLYEWQQSLMGEDVQNSSAKNGGLVGVTGCINHNNNSVSIAISWEGRTETSDGANNDDNLDFGKDCGSQDNNKKRRQIIVNAFIY